MSRRKAHGSLRPVRLRLLQLLGALLPAPRPTRTLPPDASVLVIRPDHLGDLLLAAPAIGLLRRSLPDARLTYMVGPWGEEAARRGPPVDEVLTCPFPGFIRQRKPSLLQPYALLLREASRLRGRFDATLVLRPDHWWGALLAAAARIPVRVGYTVPECRPFLTHECSSPESRVPNPESRRADSGAHSGLWTWDSGLESASIVLVRRLLELVPDAVPELEPAAESFRVEPAEREQVSRLLADHGVAPNERLVVLHPGSGSPLKHWPTEHWAAVGSELIERAAARLVISGAAGEHPVAEAIVRSASTGALNLAGRTSLGELAALLERASVALGPDSGPLHLAAAVGTPTVRLFGPTDPQLFMPGAATGHIALHASLPCQPCGNLEHPPCGAVEEPPCMRELTVQEVVAATMGAVQTIADTEDEP